MTLTLTSPYMGSRKFDNKELRDYIKSVQHKLRLSPEDGVYGPATAGAVKQWKFYYGFHSKFVTTDLTDAEAQWFFGKKAQTLAQKARARLRKPDPAQLTVAERAKNAMVLWAEKGYNEHPPYTNKVPELAAIAKREGLSTWYQRMGWPWCAFATSLSALVWGGVTAKAGFAGKFNCLYVPAILDAARQGKFGMRVVSAADARPGDLVIFNWDGGVPDHIGRLVRKIDSQSFTTVEGNTSSSAAGSQSDGGGVYVRNRSIVDIQAFVRDS